MDEPEESKEEVYLRQLGILLRGCLMGQRRNHALLVVANDDAQAISMYSVNANDEFINALLIAAHTHLNVEQHTQGELNTWH